MRLTKVLTPEVVMDKRQRSFDNAFYKMVLNDISHVGPGLICGPGLLAQNEIMRGHFALAWKWRRGPGQVYHIGKDFAQAISRVEKDIPLDLLPERFFAYFSFPEGTFFETTEGYTAAVRGGFIFIGPGDETTSKIAGGRRVVWINYDMVTPPPHTLEATQFNFVNFMMPLEGSINALLDAAPTYWEGSPLDDNSIIRAFINLAAYIHSTDPQLLPTRPAQTQSNSIRKEFFLKYGVANHCTLPVVFVSWAYKQPTVYSVDSTTVAGHFRWQRHGPEFSKVKLIWIEGHERHFKKGALLE